MPAIRIAEIPNAGPQSIAPAGVALQRLSVPGFQVNPEVAQLAGAAAVDTQPLDRAARSMLTQTLELDAFSQEARAASKLGEAIQGLGNVAMEYQQKFSKAKDTADTARAETLLQATWQKQQNDQLGQPSEKWGEIWTRNLETAKRGLGEIKFSNDAAGAILPYFERWSTIKALEVESQRKKEQIAGFRKDIEAASLAKVASEDFEGAIKIINDSVKNGIHSAPEATEWSARLLDNIARKAKSEMAAGVMLKIQNDPVGAAREFEKIRRGEKSETFAEVTETADIVRFNDVADAEKNRFQRQFDEDALDLILTGQLRSEQEVRNFVGDKLPEQRVLGLLGALQEVPAERERRLAMRPMLYAMADAYDPANDDEQGTEYFRIRDSIMQLPSDQREEPLAMLRKAKNQDPGESTPLKVAVGQMKEMFEAGKFGSWEVGEDKKPLNDGEWAKYTEAGKRFAGYKSSLENWARSNPKEAADQNAVYEQFNRLITYERQLQKFQQESTSSGWFRWLMGSPAPAAPPPPPITPADVRQKLDAIKPKSSLGPDATRQQIEDEAQRIDFETPLPEMPS